ncbi:hypothetical protein [Cognatiyoonia sp. IB215182]|uniref:hypothetical protein n=1 Tax=Cognatiyoonia sp. IB215182 TaxID=3097353 RepID=UPI002A0F62A4|nr:hypothetical protein [Cognatiyoonia sp. IB215182]MDX8354283.1 hypothetical protein [Cognatiyoonia sp. IB215182]
MNSLAKLVLIAVIATLPACAVPPNETEAQRADRINRGVATGAVLVVVAAVTASVIFLDGFEDLLEENL